MSFTDDLELAIRAEFGMGSYYGWAEIPTSGTFELTLPDGPVQVEVVEHNTSVDPDDIYDTYPARQTRVVLRVGETLYLKEGEYESFEGANWDTPLREVRAIQKTVTVYE